MTSTAKGHARMSARKVSRRTLFYASPVAASAALLATHHTTPVAGAAPPAILAAAAFSGGIVASPKDYGAMGDGIADDTAAINQCLAQNREVDFGGPDTTYFVTGTLLVQQTVPQVLTGRGAAIKAGAGVNLMRFKNAAHAIGGITFDGNTQPTGIGLIVEPTAPGSRVEGCRFANMAGCGVSVGAHHTHITACVIDYCGHGSGTVSPFNTSIFIADADYCSVLDNEVLNCDWGIYFRGGDSTVGINLYQCAGNTITCASPAPPASQGISNGHGRGGKIEGNTIIGFADNSIDCMGCSDLSIVGNTTRGGKDGVFVGDEPSSGITITGNVFNTPQRGVRVQSGTAGSMVNCVAIQANTVSGPTDGGILVNRTGTAEIGGITIADNHVNLGGSGTYGVKMINAGVSRITGNRILRPRGEAIYLSGVDIVEVTGNLLQDAGYSTPNTYNALHVTGSNRVIARNNIAYGNARYAVGIVGGAGMTVTGTRWRSIGTGGVSDGATSSVLADNLQF
jgi:hypothetical protein